MFCLANGVSTVKIQMIEIFKISFLLNPTELGWKVMMWIGVAGERHRKGDEQRGGTAASCEEGFHLS